MDFSHKKEGEDKKIFCVALCIIAMVALKERLGRDNNTIPPEIQGVGKYNGIFHVQRMVDWRDASLQDVIHAMNSPVLKMSFTVRRIFPHAHGFNLMHADVLPETESVETVLERALC
jgi:hypothetical protein